MLIFSIFKYWCIANYFPCCSELMKRKVRQACSNRSTSFASPFEAEKQRAKVLIQATKAYRTGILKGLHTFGTSIRFFEY